MFTQLIEDLIAAGETEASIADAVGASQPTIHRIKKGDQKPLYELGAALVDLHRLKVSPQGNQAAA